MAVQREEATVTHFDRAVEDRSGTTIVIHYPDVDAADSVAEYIRYVAEQVEDGYTSGYVESGVYWESRA